MKRINMKKIELKNIKPNKDEFKSSFKTKAFHAGGYSVAAVAIIIAIAVAINLLVGALPSSITQFDVTSNKLFSISDETEKVLKNVKDEIDIYWIAQESQEDGTIGGLLEKYQSLNKKIKITKKDPDIYPGFAKEYTDGTVNNNSIVVVNGERYKYVDYYDIYQYEGTSYYDYDVNFAGESAITGAIDYVSRDDLPVVYSLTGHGESELTSGIANAVANDNINIVNLSLVSAGGIPEDADSLLINAPESDISAEEKTILEEYLKKGGNLILITAPQKNLKYENLEALMGTYGVTAADGIVVEGNQNNFAWNSPHYLLPVINSHEITDPLINGGYNVLMVASQGLKIGEQTDENITVTSLLDTSDSAYSKLSSYDMQTFEKEDGDIDGPFSLAVAITDQIDDNTTSNIVWITSSYLLDDQLNAQVSGGNQDFFLNAINWMCGETDGITIHAKSLSTEYLTMGSGISFILTIIIVGIIPISVLVAGIIIWIRRKRR